VDVDVVCGVLSGGGSVSGWVGIDMGFEISRGDGVIDG